MNSKEFLEKIVATEGVSGFEQPVARVISEAFAELSDEVRSDTLGNVIALKRGEGENRPRIMLAGHMDEIGLMITKIDDRGFLSFTQVGGIDQRTLVSQEVVVHATTCGLPGIIGMKPPHLIPVEERNAAIKMSDMVIDLGLPVEEVRQKVRVGDVATISREMIHLAGDFVAGKAMDDRASVAVIYHCLAELQKLRHTSDVYAVATVQEEVGLRGAMVSTYHLEPDIGIAIDVCHGDMPGVPEQDTAGMGKGPNIAFGANIHGKVYRKLVEVAKENNIPFTLDAVPAASGTDAWAMQVTRAGVCTGLISIPTRYMHTSVETLSFADIRASGKLLAHFIAAVDSEFVEGLLCY